MTEKDIRIKITGNNRDDIRFTLSADGTAATLTFRPKNGTAANITAVNEDISGITQFKSRAAAHTPANIAATTAVSITCSLRKARLIQSMFLLKDTLKGEVHDEKNQFNVVIKCKYDDAEGILQEGANTTIQLLEKNIPGEPEEIIKINPTDITKAGFPMLANGDDAQNASNNLKTYKDELVKIFKLLWKIEDKFKYGDGDISTYADIDTDIETLVSYVDGAGAGAVAAGAVGTDPDKEKKTVYNLSTDGTNRDVVKGEIDNYTKILKELWAYNRIVGLNTLEEVLKAHANGIVLVQRNGASTVVPKDWGNGTLWPADDKNVTDVLEKIFPNANGKYNGFDIVDKDQEPNLPNGNADAVYGNNYIFGKRFDKSEKGLYLKDAIDNFLRAFSVPEDDWGGKGNYRGFCPMTNTTYTVDNANVAKNGENATAATYDGGTLDIMDDKTLIRGCLDKDVGSFAKGDNKDNRPDERKLSDLTKTCFDILNETTTPAMRNAIETLLHNDYDGAGVGQKKAVLDMQFIALQNAQMGNADQKYEHKNPAGKYENAEKANEAYDEGVNFLTYFDVDYTDRANWNKDNKASELEKAKTELEKYKNGGSENIDNPIRLIYEFWQREKGGGINEKIEQIKDALKEGTPNPDDSVFDKVEDLKNAKEGQAENSKGRKIYEEFERLSNKTNSLFLKLKGLVDELNKGYDSDEIDKPEEWKNKYSSGDEGKVWKLVNDHTKDGFEAEYKDKGWAAYVAEEAVKKLTSERKAAGDSMKDEGDAKVKTGIETEPSIKTAKAIGELFNFCKEAWGTIKSDREAGLKNDLIKYRDGTVAKGKEAWKRVNEYEKGGKKYADEALAKAGAKKEENDKLHEELMKLADLNEVWEKGKGALGEERTKRIMIAIGLKNGSEDEKLVSEILGKKSEDEYNDSEDKVEESIQNIIKHIDKLEGLINAADDSEEAKLLEKIKSLNTNIGDPKPVLEAWKKILEARKQHLETKQEEYKKGDNNKNDTPEKPWWKTPLGMIGIAAGILLVVGAVAYFMKSNSSEEGEGESE